MKLLYSLGEGCFVHEHLHRFNYLKGRMAEHIIFKGTTSYPLIKGSLFPPLALFNGVLEEEFLNGNFEVLMTNCKEFNQVINEIRVRNPKTSLCFAHITRRHTKELFNAERIKKRFDYFKENMKSFIYIIDFSRVAYRSYGNKAILDFEKCVLENNVDINNFYYLIPEDKIDILKNVQARVISCPLDKLQLCGKWSLYFGCCSCYFYKYYEKELLSRLNED